MFLLDTSIVYRTGLSYKPHITEMGVQWGHSSNWVYSIWQLVSQCRYDNQWLQSGNHEKKYIYIYDVYITYSVD